MEMENPMWRPLMGESERRKIGHLPGTLTRLNKRYCYRSLNKDNFYFKNKYPALNVLIIVWNDQQCIANQTTTVCVFPI